eukprot:20039-Eustigmatos_ZCMA.PRE.1
MPLRSFEALTLLDHATVTLVVGICAGTKSRARCSTWGSTGGSLAWPGWTSPSSTPATLTQPIKGVKIEA